MTKNLTEGSPAKLIFFFTMPLIAGNIFQQLYAFVDTLIVGRFLGVNALAAVGCTGALMFLMLGFVIGFSTGLSIYTGQRFGARDEEGVRKSAAACAVLYSFISLVYAGIGLFVFYQTQTNLIRALGDSKTPTVLLACGLTLNIIFEPIAILVFGWGIPGAALATLASQVCGNLLCLFFILRKVPALRTHRKDWCPDFKLYWEHLRIALPMGFQSSIIAIGAVILQVALNDLGPTAVAAYAAAQKIESIAMMPMMSFGIAMSAYTAQNYGARKFERIGEGVRKCCYMSVTFAVLAGAGLIFFGPSLMHLFVGDGAQQVIDFGHEYLIVNGSCYWILSFLFIFRYTLQGLGQSVVPTIAGIMELLMRTAAALFLCGWLG